MQDMSITKSSRHANMLPTEPLPVAHITQRSLTLPKTRQLVPSAQAAKHNLRWHPSAPVNSDVDASYDESHHDHGLAGRKDSRQASGSTVDRILNQYIPSSELNSSSPSFPLHTKKRMRSESPYSIPLDATSTAEHPKGEGFSAVSDLRILTHKDRLASRFGLSKIRDDTPTKVGRLPLRNNLTSPTPDDQDMIDGLSAEEHTVGTQPHLDVVATISLPGLPASKAANAPTIFGSKSAGAKANAANLLGTVPETGGSLKVTTEEQTGTETHHFTADRVASGIGSLLPPPHRMHSNRSRGVNQSSFISGTGKSTGNLTTDSDDDPFRYDRQSFGVFLQPSKEREVSAALRHVSGLSMHSMGTIYSPDGTPLKTKSRLPVCNTSPQSVDRFDGSVRRTGSRNKNAESFYNTSAIQSKWAVGAASDRIKVPVQRVAP